MTIRIDLIRRIHVLKRDTGIDDETYRSIVYQLSGVDSCALIHDVEMLNLICTSLQRLKDRIGSPVETNSSQHRFIARLMDHLGWSWQDTARYCRRITGKDSTRRCTPQELSNVIRGMVATIDHHLETGKIAMSRSESNEYFQHTRHQRGGDHAAAA